MNHLHWITLVVGILLGYFIVPPVLAMIGVKRG